MDIEDLRPEPPEPPRSVPPLPPPPEMIAPRPTHVPLTPMMDFLQRRLETAEKELSLERERARSAEALMKQQEALRAEVESHLKSLSEQLRREKAERESSEMQSHARGRIDALEKRLDEMQQAWVSLLKEAVGQRQAGDQASSAAQGALKAEVAALSQNLESRLSASERRQALEDQRQEERLEALSRERTALLRAWEEQNHGLRQEFVKERIQREADLGAQISELARGLEELKAGGEQAARESAESRSALSKALEKLATPPQAKDQTIAALEREKTELQEALGSRTEALQKYAQERRQLDAAMGEGLMELNRQLDSERRKYLELSARISGLELERESLKDKLESVQRTSQDKDERASRLEAERDALARALIAEAEKVRSQIDERSRSEEDWGRRLSELQKRLAEEIQLRIQESTAVSELRAQLATLSEHMAKTLQEKDLISNRSSSWAQERERLLAALKEKEAMISTLSATFQKIIKNP